MPSLEPASQINYVNYQQLHQLQQQQQINTNSSDPFSTRLRTHNSQLNSSQLHRPAVPEYAMNFSGNQVELEAECRRSPHQAQPYLINLDRRGGKTPLFRYPLPMGVTMLGSGKACVKPPDIVLHGPLVAPQHCFIDRREDEITLHPISELTILEDTLISQPTPLRPGNVISIGESHVFRFESPQAKEYQTPSQILYESPYAVIRSGASNPSRTAGDVNKNSFHTMEIMEGSLTGTVGGAVGHNEEASSPSPSSVLRSFGAGDENTAKKYRDGLESDNFDSKVARFEYLAHTQRPPPFPTVNSVFPQNTYSNGQQNLTNGNHSYEFDYSQDEHLAQNHYQSGSSSHANGNNYSPDNDNNHRFEQTNGFPNKSGYSSAVRQLPAYNNNYHSPCYSAEEYNNNSLTSSNNNSSDRIPLSYRRSYTDSPSPTTISNPYVYGSTSSPTTASNLYTSTSNSFNQFKHEDNSSPSPDSFSSSNHHHVIQTQLNGNISSNSTYSRNSDSQYSNSRSHYENTMDNSIACETLLEMKRKQAQEARHAAQTTENSDKLRLEEILEMCAEYDEQISRELEERRQQTPTTHNSIKPTEIENSTYLTPPKANQSNGHGTSPVIRNSSQSASASGDDKSPGTPNSLYYSRIKTNGSLPREKKNSPCDAGRPPSGSNNGITDEEIASPFTFNLSDTSSCNSNYYSNSLTNGNGYGSACGGDEDVFSPPSGSTLSTPNKAGVNSPSLSVSTGTPEELRNNRSPYENIMNLNSNRKYVPKSPQETSSQQHSSYRTRIKTTVTALSTPTTNTSPVSSTSNNSFSNGKTALEVKETNYPRRPIITTVLEPIHSSCSSSPTSSTTSSSSFHNNSSSHPSLTQNGINVNVSGNINVNVSGNINVNLRNERTNSNNSSNNNSNSNVDKIERCETPPKSKLSVSFAKSVEEYHDVQIEEEGGEDGENSRRDLHSTTRNGRSENNSGNNCSRTKESFSRPIVKTIATEVQVHVEDCSSNNNSNSNNKNNSQSLSSLLPLSFNNWTESCKTETEDEISSGSGSPSHSNSSHRIDNGSFSTEANGTDNDTTSNASTRTTDSSSSPYQIYMGDNRIANLKKEIGEVEQQEMEALREMEIEKALLVGEEKSLGTQLQTDKMELDGLKERLSQINESHRRWKIDSLERIGELKGKLIYSEKELQRLERMHEEFCGSTDEETIVLERLKFQHELVESDRKSFEDAEFHHMEEEVNKEAQRDELSKTLADAGKKLLADKLQLEQLKSQNRISFSSSGKEIQNLEKKRQKLLKELQKLRETVKPISETLSIPDTHTDNLSDSEDMKNSDLEEKLRALALSNLAAEDAIRIERVMSRSPIDPILGGTMGPKTCETLREIERNREFLLNEQGVQMLEEERQRVRELQKRVQDAVREEWEASRKSRSNQCQSLNSVGSDDSTQTISDTPTTDSGCSDDATTNKSGAPSLSTTDVSLNGAGNGLCGIDMGMAMEMAIGGTLGQNSFELCQQMRQKQRDMSQSFEETRPLSDGSAYDNGSSIVTMRDKHRVQNRPLTRYLPVRGDEDDFDLRAHIESSGHQLELCPHVIVTSSTARGFLSKLGSRFHNWNKRWFVFDRDTRTFSYYSDKNEKKPRGGIHFQAIEEVYVDHLQSVKSPIPKLTFCVKTYSRVFHLLAPSAEAMRIWIDIIFTGAEGYQEFKCAP